MTKLESGAVAMTLAVSVAALAASAVRGDGKAEWGYTAQGRHVPPVDWGDVSKTCTAGKSQSPIAISTPMVSA